MATRRITQSCLHHGASTSTSAARAFLQLAPRRTLHTTHPLEFLVPAARRPAQSRSLRKQPALLHPSARSFTSSPERRQTTAVVNPRKDDDGNDMNVEITPRASNRLKEIMAQDGNPDLALRIQVESGGCHGFQYLMSLTTLPPISSNGLVEESSQAPKDTSADSNATAKSTTPSEETAPLDEDDTVFAADDGSGAKVVMDGPSLELLKGSKIDYTMELIGSQFKIVDNPLATSSCGCGTSFDIKA
ncbi:hypothetical protein BP5796_08661 [Coleophoma crateriformis]|uniref:FeS cluster biogenesis domain-containing protein n=1 Tax=Coleophoma crateriformis TaxID=565419 RepID=A0A3D8R8T2_9HELO|nr:hypothetical protein BP5796_08661 [Coleophoma crateriformis]